MYNEAQQHGSKIQPDRVTLTFIFLLRDMAVSYMRDGVYFH